MSQTRFLYNPDTFKPEIVNKNDIKLKKIDRSCYIKIPTDQDCYVMRIDSVDVDFVLQLVKDLDEYNSIVNNYIKEEEVESEYIYVSETQEYEYDNLKITETLTQFTDDDLCSFTIYTIKYNK